MDRPVEQTQSEESANMTVADTPMSNDQDGSTTVHFCNVCYKPIVRESAFKRHLAYCRRSVGKPKKRKRSCKHCHRAKAKCSFEPQCSRCSSKGLICEYEKLSMPSPSNEMSDDLQDTPMSELCASSPSDATLSPGAIYTDLVNFEKATAISELPLISPPRLVTELRTDLRHQASALLLLEIIRGLPYMMSRRETFPVFIHGQWHQPELPTTLANCMRISQLFLARHASPQGREIFYTAMTEERTRILQHLSTAPKEELLFRLAMNFIYTLLIVFDNETPQTTLVPELEARKFDVDAVQKAAHVCFASDAYAPFDIDSIGTPSETWEEFIYAESRRRSALFWFVVSRVIDLKSGRRCPPVLCYRGLALPAPEALWGARTREAWETARAEMWERGRDPHHNVLRTFGDLIDSRAAAGGERQVSGWLASCDKLGLMLAVASTMV